MDYLTNNETPAQSAASRIIETLNRALLQRITSHQEAWGMLWENGEATPQEIFDVLGTSAVKVLQAGAQSRADLTAIATSKGVELSDLLGEEKYATVGAPITVNPDGTVIVNIPTPEEE